MDLRAPVIGHAAIVFSVPEHAGHRSNAQARDFLARVERSIHLHDQGGGWSDGEAVCPSDAWGIHERIYCECAVIWGWPYEPEGREHREFLSAVHPAVDGQPAGR